MKNDLRNSLDALFEIYHHRRYVPPDPLQFLYDYDDPADREVVAVLAASLAYGQVRQIIVSVGRVLEVLGPSPRRYLADHSRSQVAKALGGFKHRFNTGAQVAAMLDGVRKVAARHGTLGRCMEQAYRSEHESLRPALTALAGEIQAASSLPWNQLLVDPSRGSACKRLNLMLRWLVRTDGVDPGGWNLPAYKLTIPLDTHMHRLGRVMGATARNAGDARTAEEITAFFRQIDAQDPVRYDFCLTRLAMRKEMDCQAFEEYWKKLAK